MGKVFRWVLVIPSSIAGYFICMFLGMANILVFEKICPEQYIVSEMCTAGYMKYVENISLIVFPSLAAVLVVLFPFLMAPSNKFKVSGISYVIGAVIAVYIGIETKAYLILSTVLVSGAITLYIIHRVITVPSKSMQPTANASAD